MFRIWIGNLGKSNEGFSIGEWIDLPAERGELEALYKSIGLSYTNEDGEYIPSKFTSDYGSYEEFYIADYENDIGYEVGEYEPIYTLNDIAERLESLNSSELESFKNLLETCSDIEEAFRYVSDGSYYFAKDIKDEETLGHCLLDNDLFHTEVPENIKEYLDYEVIGNEHSQYGDFTKDGYVHKYQ